VEKSGQNFEAAAWLDGEGRTMVADRMQASAERAGELILGWLDKVEGDSAALWRILAGAAASDYVGPRFHNLVVDGYKRHRAPAQLPLGPVGIKKVARDG
jgi:hypothetical protein